MKEKLNKIIKVLALCLVMGVGGNIFGNEQIGGISLIVSVAFAIFASVFILGGAA